MALDKLSGTFYVRYYLGGLGGSVTKDTPSELQKKDYPNYGPIYKVVWKDGKRIAKDWYSN